jgi:phosphate:Na+ symporter
MNEVLPLLIGGLTLFLYAITRLSEVMNAIFSDNATRIIQQYTSNLYVAILLGTFLTVLLGSSSAVIILVIVFINAESLSFKNAIGLIMGANIGTTVSSQLIALDIGAYAIYPLFVGLLFEIFVKNKQWKQFGRFLFYFGMLFFGLFLMEQSVSPLRDSEMFPRWIARAEGNPLAGALIGGLTTVMIQSSSGTVGIAIVLGKQQLLSVAGGIAIMLGAELGTCSDTLIATLNGSRQALKAGLFHFSFNLITITIGLVTFHPFVAIVERISSTSDIGKIIANAHVSFNLLGVLLFVPFVHLMAKGLNKLIPEKQ